jgi:hypothetical protein
MTAQVRFEVLHVKGIYLQPTRVKILSRFFVQLGSCLLCSVTTSQARALNDQGSPVVTDSGKHKAEDNRPIAENYSPLLATVMTPPAPNAGGAKRMR